MNLRAKVLGTLLVLVVGLHLAMSSFVLERSRREAEAHARAQLEAGGRVFARLVKDREEQLLTNVSVLASDFGMRGAIATGDRATVASALQNHGDRVRADLTFFVDLEGNLEALSPAHVVLKTDRDSFRHLFEEAKKRGRASGMAVASNAPHQIVLAPVNTPRTIGWVGMGFELNVELAQELRELTGLEVTFWANRDADLATEGSEIASTLGPKERTGVVRAIEDGRLRRPTSEPFLLEETDWISLPVLMYSGDGEKVGAALQTSYAASMLPYQLQRTELIRFFALGLAMALVGAMLISRRLTKPILALAEGARAISQGDLSARVEESDSRDEIGELARSFRVMQKAVADREQRILHESLHDQLTGLPNRLAARSVVSERLGEHACLGVVTLDILRLKDVNGTLGTAIGDEVLVQTARRLEASPGVDWSARVGPGCFLVLIPVGEASEIEARVEALLASLERFHAVRGAQIALRFCAGIAVAPEDGRDTEVLMRRAEMALGVAKTAGVPVSRYAAGLEESHHRRVGILIELERALERGDLELHYQPKVEIATRRVVGAEALIRWTHAEMGRMNPEEFIGIAEQSGFIGRVSDWVLEEAIGQAARWSTAGLDLCLSINLSAHDAADESLPDKIMALLERAGANPGVIQIEVTESAVMENPEHAAMLLQRIRDRGVGISIDDFGTGHSSLAQLRTLPSDELKIDQAFVRELRLGTPDEAIVRTAIDLGHSLGLKVVAEGVEDSGVLRLLGNLGCDIAQGYGLGRPMPASEFATWMERFDKETQRGS